MREQRFAKPEWQAWGYLAGLVCLYSMIVLLRLASEFELST